MTLLFFNDMDKREIISPSALNIFCSKSIDGATDLVISSLNITFNENSDNFSSILTILCPPPGWRDLDFLKASDLKQSDTSIIPVSFRSNEDFGKEISIGMYWKLSENRQTSYDLLFLA